MKYKKINRDLIKEYFEYSEESPSGILWKKSIVNAAGIEVAKKGTVAGSIHPDTLYYIVKLKSVIYYVHRLIVELHDTATENNIVDHIDGNRQNNLFSNLRLVTKLENAKNAKMYSTNTSGICGVRWRDSSNGWIVSWRENNKERQKLFTIFRFGSKDKALEFAIKFREAKLVELKDYTERHGK